MQGLHSKKMALVQRLLKNVKSLVTGSISLVASIVGGIIESVGWLVPIGLILLGVALFLIILREFFLESIPTLKVLTAALCFAWELIVIALRYIKMVWDWAFDLLENIVNDVDDAVPGISLKDLIGGIEDFRSLFVVPGTLSADETNRWMQDILDRCVDYDDAWGVITRFVHYNTHADACAFARYVYPVPWVYNFVNPVMLWFYSGASDPIVDHYAIPGHHNCENTIGDGEPIDVACSALGAGFVLLDVALPLLAVLLLLVWCGRDLLTIIGSLLSIAWLVIATTVTKSFKLIFGL